MDSTIRWIDQTINAMSSWIILTGEDYLGVEIYNNMDAHSHVRFESGAGDVFYSLMVPGREKMELAHSDWYGDCPLSLTIKGTTEIHARAYYRGADADGPLPSDGA